MSGSATVPGSPLGQLFSALPAFGGLTNFDMTTDQDFQNQGVTKKDVQSVKITAATLQISNPNSQDFSWLQSLQLNAQMSDGSMSQEIAQKSGIDQLGLMPPNPQFSLDVDNVELAPYVTAPSMQVGTTATGHQPPQDTTVQLSITVKVVANVVK